MNGRLDDSRLWAKRWLGNGPKESAYLPGHLCDVYKAAQHVLDTTAKVQLEAIGLSTSDWLDRFRRGVSLAAAVHDLGKCNNQFQGMLRNNVRQALRHEWVGHLAFESCCK